MHYKRLAFIAFSLVVGFAASASHSSAAAPRAPACTYLGNRATATSASASRCLATCIERSTVTRTVPGFLEEQQELDAPRFQACVASCPGTVNGYECADRLYRFYGGTSPIEVEITVLATTEEGSAERDLYLGVIRDLNRYTAQCMVSPATASCLRRCDAALVTDGELSINNWHACILACPNAPTRQVLMSKEIITDMVERKKASSESSTENKTLAPEEAKTDGSNLSKTLAPETKTILSNDAKTFLTENTPPPATTTCADNCARNGIVCIKSAITGEELQACQKQTNQCNEACAMMK